MLSPLDYLLSLVGLLLEVGVVVCLVRHRQFLHYLFINLFLLCSVTQWCGGFFCIRRFGYTSTQYFYFYYYTEGLLCILMYLIITQFYQQVLAQMKASRYVRGAALLLLLLTVLFSYVVVQQNKGRMTNRFVVELEQNLNFIGVVLMYLLWGAIVKLRETRARLVQLVLALGIYFSAIASCYALRTLFPAWEGYFLKWFPPLVALWLSAAWAYTFTKIPEDMRLATTRLAVGVR